VTQLLIETPQGALAITSTMGCVLLGRPANAHYDIPLADLPWSAMAIEPAAAAALANEVVLHGRTRDLEFGPGISTVIMALAADVARRPVEIVAVEQDARWAQRVRDLVPTTRYASAIVVDAPVAPFTDPAPFDISRWYDRSALAYIEGLFDLVIVDGPTAFRPEWSHDRWPALPFAEPLLAPTAAVVLDDVNRDGEREILEDWLTRSHSDWRSEQRGRSAWLSRTARPTAEGAQDGF
jgi:predicted O-methyltransferase YrrM